MAPGPAPAPSSTPSLAKTLTFTTKSLQAHTSRLPSPDTVRKEWLRTYPCPPNLDIAALGRLLDHDNYEMRDELRRFLCTDYFTPQHDIALADERALALARLRRITQVPGRFISVRDFLHNPLRVFAAHELIGLADGSLATKLTVQFNLAGGTVLKLGTERHHAILDDIDSLSAVGCFALTELSYGNNAIAMETTAIYEHSTQEFVIHTPSVGGQKYWITNGAIHAHFAVVFAQLILDGQSKGVHAFVVPIRDRATHRVLPGVFIEDMGHKIGCNGVDNARLAFNHVRVARSALLNRYSDVLPDGSFKCSTRGKRALFIKVADQLLSGRLCISSMMIGTAKLACTIATRYAMSRLAVGESGESDTPLLAMRFQQRSLAPFVARVYACAIALDYAKDRYVALQGANEDDWREVVVLCCAIKPLVAWTTENVVSKLRERCGGQGYLSSNRFGDFVGFAHAGITAEGDAAVLMQKVAKELLVLVKQGRHVLYNSSNPLPHHSFSELDTLDVLLATRESILVKKLANSMAKATRDGTIYETWMMRESNLVQATAMAYAELLAFRQMTAVCRDGSAGSNSVWIAQLQKLYALDCIENDLGWFVSNAVITPADRGCQVEVEIQSVCAQIGSLLPHFVDAFSIPDQLVHAPIAGDWIKFNALPHPFAKL